jgi:hypothetical protein
MTLLADVHEERIDSTKDVKISSTTSARRA